MFHSGAKPNGKITQGYVFLLSMSCTKYNFFFIPIGVFLLLSFKSPNKSAEHPFYVSVSEIKIDDHKNQISLSCKLFTDDLQEALYKLYNFKSDLSTYTPEQDSMLNLYIQNHVALLYGNHPVKLSWLGYEIETEVVWCYLEAPTRTKGTKVQMTNKLLYDYIPGQSNIIHCFLNSKRKSTKLNQPESVAVFEF